MADATHTATHTPPTPPATGTKISNINYLNDILDFAAGEFSPNKLPDFADK